MDLLEEDILGDALDSHWYYRAKSLAMLRALRDVRAATAIDIGSGSGFFARELLLHTDLEQVDCVDTSYDEDTDDVVPSGGVLRRRRNLAEAADNVDLAVLMDVLEHVDNDTDLLRAAADRVRTGGHVFITVPAFSWLWSSHDVFLGHVRRYDRLRLTELAERADLEILESHYIFGPVFPAAVVQRLFDRTPKDQAKSKLAVYPRPINEVLYGLASLERPLQRFNRLAGLSVVLLATVR